MLYVWRRCTKVKEGLKRDAFSPFAFSDSADVESLSQDSSDEENEEREEEEQKAEETSMEEALRKVTETSDHGREEPHKQNIGILEESRRLSKRHLKLTCSLPKIDEKIKKK